MFTMINISINAKPIAPAIYININNTRVLQLISTPEFPEPVRLYRRSGYLFTPVVKQ